MENSENAIQLPVGDVAISVSLINPANFGPAALSHFMEPPVPGLETLQRLPSHSFLLEHPSGRRLVFDLGIRKDYKNLAAPVLGFLPPNIEVDKHVVEMLEDGGVAPTSIEAVIWSHWHWDHTGDPSTFPSSTDLIVGPGFKKAMLPGAPANPESPILESDYAGRNMREITFEGEKSLSIGKFPAYDYFGDGSFYLLDSPGHAVGHLCGLARTTSSPDSFVLLGGDICHYPGIFRPSKHLPMPESVTPHPCHPEQSISLCPGHAWEELQRSRNREPTDTLYSMTYGDDIPLATKTAGHMQELDCLDNVFVIIAHDSAVRDNVAHFPSTLNDWMENDWARKLRWTFLKDLEQYWKSKDL